MSYGLIIYFSWKTLLRWKRLDCVGKLVWSFIMWTAALPSYVRWFNEKSKRSRTKVGWFRILRAGVFQVFCHSDFWHASIHHRVCCSNLCSIQREIHVPEVWLVTHTSFRFSSSAYEFNTISFSRSTCTHCKSFGTLNKQHYIYLEGNWSTLQLERLFMKSWKCTDIMKLRDN